MKKKLLIGADPDTFCGYGMYFRTGDWQSYSGDKRIEERVDSVLALMTLEEKIGQMTQYSAKSDIVTGPQVNTDIEPLLKKGYIGSLFHATSSATFFQFPEVRICLPCASPSISYCVACISINSNLTLYIRYILQHHA